MNSNLLLILLCLVLGFLLRRTGRFPEKTPQAFNAFVIWISLPALVLIQIPSLLARDLVLEGVLIPISMAWILFTLAYVFFTKIGPRLGWSRETIGALVLTAGLGNTSFVGFPLLESLLGPETLRVGVLVDQPGTFLVLATAGILVASLLSPQSSRRPTARETAARVFGFPPFAALIAALIWGLSGAAVPPLAFSVLERLAQTLVPLALVAVGFQLNVSRARLRRAWRPLGLGLTFKLFLAPLFFWILYRGVLGSHTFETRVTILESAMAPMITAGVVAEEFGLSAEVASLMLGIGIPLSILTVSLWNTVI